MFGFVNHENEFQCNFPASKADLIGTVGYQIKSGGVVVIARTTAGIFENGFGSYGMKLTFAEAFTGSIIWDTGDADIKRAQEEINIVPYPATDLTALSAAVDAIPTNPLLATDPRLDHLDADISSIAGGDVSVDLTPVLEVLGNPLYGLAANMALLVDVDNEVDTIHTQVGDIHTDMENLGAALSAGLATEVTQQEILTLLTIPDYEGPVVTVPISPAPGLQALYGEVSDPSGVAVAGVTVSAELTQATYVDNDFLLEQTLTYKSAENGTWSLILIQGCKYKIKIPRHSKEYTITVSDQATATLASYLEVV